MNPLQPLLQVGFTFRAINGDLKKFLLIISKFLTAINIIETFQLI